MGWNKGKGLLAAALLWCAAVPGWAAEQPPAMAATPAWVQDEPLPAAAGASGGLRYELVSDQVDLSGAQPLWYRRVSYTVLRDNALGDAGQISLYYQPDYQHLALNHLEVWRDGQRMDLRRRAHYAQLRRESDLEQGLLDGALTLNISLPDLRVGDRIDYAYTVTGSNPVFGRGYYDSYTARYDVPLGARRLRVRYPAGMPLNWKVSTEGFRASRQRVGTMEELHLEADSLAAVRAEKDTPPGHDTYGRIELSTAPHWRAVADWAAALYPHGFQDPAVARAMAVQLKLDRADPQGSMQRAIAFVQGDIRYLGLEMGVNSHAPHTPEETLRNRYGDCKDKATLLVALLGLAGVAAEPVLVDSSPGNQLSARLPSPLAFDHVVVRARTQGREFWIDATRDREYGTFDARSPLPFGQGLPVRVGQAALVDIPYPQATVAEVAVEEDVDIAMAKPRRLARFSVVTDYLHGRGDGAREMFESQGAEALGDQYLEYMQRFYSQLQLDGLPTVDEADPARLRIAETYRLDWHPRENDVVGFPLFQLQDWMKELPRTARRTPLALGGPRLATQTVRVRSDAGIWVKPQRDVVENPWFRFSRRIDVQDGELVIEGEWERRALSIPPDGVRRAANDMARARELLFFEHNFRPDPLRSIGVAAWLYALAGLGVTLLLLGAAGWSAWRGGLGGMLYTPYRTARRVFEAPRLRTLAWVAFGVSYLLVLSLYREGGTGAMLKQVAWALLQWTVGWSVFWGVLRLVGVRLSFGRLATALAAGMVPQLPLLAGAVVATLGSVAWMTSAGSAPPAAWPGIFVTGLLGTVAMVWTVASSTASVAVASHSSRLRVLAAWGLVFVLALFAGGLALFVRLAAQHAG
ncbi:DUF3857 domain-containing protein [Stenotrophomonas sp. HITSZ_GD]|uniref:DUF3857 domain-containing protein n=1 Tax=Stenotrophomonas sp. HITSZ_GD TaxID=3037248 RepID=UPI00240CF68F|nr:DUF3857 domain-containing protein [Stenotrophomonas sp. HITSZ_GD]MDG2526541.1 DUF3857 domain-containing protein [Stenotrophomonas sp. HITSZ_GD]